MVPVDLVNGNLDARITYSAAVKCTFRFNAFSIGELKPLLPDKLTPKSESPLSKYSLFAMGGYIEKKKEMEKKQ